MIHFLFLGAHWRFLKEECLSQSIFRYPKHVLKSWVQTKGVIQVPSAFGNLELIRIKTAQVPPSSLKIKNYDYVLANNNNSCLHSLNI